MSKKLLSTFFIFLLFTINYDVQTSSHPPVTITSVSSIDESDELTEKVMTALIQAIRELNQPELNQPKKRKTKLPARFKKESPNNQNPNTIAPIYKNGYRLSKNGLYFHSKTDPQSTLCYQCGKVFNKNSVLRHIKTKHPQSTPSNQLVS